MSDKAKISVKKPEIKKSKSVQAQKSEHNSQINSTVDHIFFLQRTIGNQAVQRLFDSGVIQAKLKIGQPGDKYEQEADRVVGYEKKMQKTGITENLKLAKNKSVYKQKINRNTKHMLQIKSISASNQCGGNFMDYLQRKPNLHPYSEKNHLHICFPPFGERHTKQIFHRLTSGEVPDCGDKSYGETGCDFEEGIPTGKMWINIEDTNPCTRPCTVLHERSHIKDIEPLCRKHKACYDQAGDNEDARIHCDNESADRLISIHKFTECKAYGLSLECLKKQLNNSECKSEKQQRILRERIAEEECYLQFYCFQSLKEIARRIWDYLKTIFGPFIEKFRSKWFSGRKKDNSLLSRNITKFVRIQSRIQRFIV